MVFTAKRLALAELWYFLLVWVAYMVAAANFKVDWAKDIGLIYGFAFIAAFATVGFDKEKLMIRGGLSSKNLMLGVMLFVVTEIILFSALQYGLLSGLEGNPLYASMFEQISMEYLSFVANCIVGITEEIIFRGMMLAKVKSMRDFYVSNSFQALIFAIIHFYRYGVKIGLLLTYGVIAWIYGYVAWKYKTINPGIVSHILNNLYWVSR